MKFTEEQLKKMNAAKTAEELIALAKAEGIEATEEQIRAQFAAMHKEGELADDELDNVSGAGCGESEPEKRRAKFDGKLGYATLIQGGGYYNFQYYFTSDDGTYKDYYVWEHCLEFV